MSTFVVLCIYSQGSLYTLSRPRNYKELFNYQHALLRNHIERIFGLFKRHFKVLLVAQEYNLKTQAQLIPALAVIHNFIRIHDPGDLPESEDNYEGGNGDGDGDCNGHYNCTPDLGRWSRGERVWDLARQSILDVKVLDRNVTWLTKHKDTS